MYTSIAGVPAVTAERQARNSRSGRLSREKNPTKTITGSRSGQCSSRRSAARSPGSAGRKRPVSTPLGTRRIASVRRPASLQRRIRFGLTASVSWGDVNAQLASDPRRLAAWGSSCPAVCSVRTTGLARSRPISATATFFCDTPCTWITSIVDRARRQTRRADALAFDRPLRTSTPIRKTGTPSTTSEDGSAGSTAVASTEHRARPRSAAATAWHCRPAALISG